MSETSLSLSDVAAEVAAALSYPKISNEGSLVVTPLLYPGGARTVVRLLDAEGGYLVSDYGAGRREAELMGGHRVFTRIARDTAARYQVRFDSDMFFDLEVPREALVAAVIAVANASKVAVDATAEALSERRANDQKTLMWEKLDTAFGGGVEKQASVRGATASWDFDARIATPTGEIVFDLVRPFPSSVHAAVAKFLDLQDVGAAAPRRFAVISDMKETPHLALLGRTARIIDLKSRASQFKQVA